MSFTVPKITLSNTATALLCAGAFLSILALVPITQNFVDESKLYLIIATSVLMGVLFAISIVRRGGIEMVLSKATFVTLTFFLAMIASTFFTSAYPVKGILGFGGIAMAASLLTLFAAPLLNSASKKVWLATFSSALMVVVVASVLELAGVGPSRLLPLISPFNLPLQAILFNLTGSIFNALQLTIIGAIGIGATWFVAKKVTPFQIVAMVGMLLGVALYGYFLLPGKTPLQLPSLSASWSVALDSIRDPRGALIGAGTGSYQAMYQQFKPVWMNSTPQWSITFTNAANYPLTLLTISGFIGLITWFALVIVVAMEIKGAKKEEIPVIAMLVATFVFQVFFPPSILLLGIQAMLLALFIAGKRQTQGVLHFNFFHAQLHQHKSFLPQKNDVSKWPLYITSSVLLLGLAVGSYYLVNYYLAAFYSFRAAVAFQNNDALNGYNYQQLAFGLNPYLDSYRRDYALTSLGIAEILANKTDKTAEDESTIAQLIQQAVREVQAANALDSRDARNPLLAATIYQRLIGSVDGAESFAEQYYIQGINLFPTAPDSYIGLAGIYIQKKDWNTAINVLSQGLRIKADFPNLLYNMAFALEQAQALADAKAFYERTRATLTDTTGEDYAALTKKIDELAGLIEAQQQAQAAQSNQQTGEQTGAENSLRQDQNPSALDLNLNPTPEQSATDVQVNDAQLPASEPSASTSDEMLMPTDQPAP